MNEKKKKKKKKERKRGGSWEQNRRLSQALGLGLGLGPPTRKAGLGANVPAWGVHCGRGAGPWQQTPGLPSLLVIKSEPSSPSPQTLLSVHCISPLSILFSCSLSTEGQRGDGGEGVSRDSFYPTSLWNGPVRAARFCAWLSLQGGHNPLFHFCGQSPALTAFITITINRLC
jgi:hypothetical protein